MGCVKSFINNFPSESLILDVGCNSKYMNYRNDIHIKRN